MQLYSMASLRKVGELLWGYDGVRDINHILQSSPPSAHVSSFIEVLLVVRRTWLHQVAARWNDYE